MKKVVLVLGLSFFSMISGAANWIIQPNSSLAFEGTQQGEVFTGRFQRFSALIVFDPNNLAHAKFDVNVDIASVNSQNSERDDTVRGSDWFDSQRFPDARFVTTGFHAISADRFEADADLRIRDKSIAIKFPFSWKAEAESATLNAEVTLDRLDFGIGAGDWADAELIGTKVKVNVDLKLSTTTPK